MASLAGANSTTGKLSAAASAASENSNLNPTKSISWRSSAARFRGGRMCVPPVAAAPEKISEKVEESIKNAKETCSEDPVSGECAAAWDEVEELSAAASHARDRSKGTDVLENYCKENPETDECRTYDS